MAVVPAQVAGVGRIAVASPPGPDGLPAAGDPRDRGDPGGGRGLRGRRRRRDRGVCRTGRPASRRSRSSPGPGSSWVQEAKRQVSGVVGIDGFAGPERGDDRRRRHAPTRTAIALDLLAQAEHGPDSVAALASHDAAFLDAVAAALAGEAAPIGAVTLVDCPDLDVAVALAEAFAPEHLEICVPRCPRTLPIGSARQGRCSSGRTVQLHTATTSPVQTMCCPPGARRDSRRPSARQPICGGCRLWT